jgi:hypothetical protein
MILQQQSFPVSHRRTIQNNLERVYTEVIMACCKTVIESLLSRRLD